MRSASNSGSPIAISLRPHTPFLSWICPYSLHPKMSGCHNGVINIWREPEYLNKMVPRLITGYCNKCNRRSFQGMGVIYK